MIQEIPKLALPIQQQHRRTVSFKTTDDDGDMIKPSDQNIQLSAEVVREDQKSNESSKVIDTAFINSKY